MKRKIAFAITMLCLSTNLCITPALANSNFDVDVSAIEIEDDDERGVNASDCINSYDTYTVANGSGRIYVYADLYTLYKGSLSATIVLQVYENGAWRQVTSWNKSSSSNSLVFSATYYGTKGKQYRAVSYFAANSGGYYDNRTKTSNTSTAY